MNNKKICFISLTNLYLCPYILKYISLIDCDYDIIYWDRHSVSENYNAKNVYAFKYKTNEGENKFNKLKGYLNFRKYAYNIIKKNNYNGIILLQTSIGILLQSILVNKYKNKFIVDIRDYTMEKNPMFYYFEKNLINKSALAVISSKGYENFLPPHNYILVHNDPHIDDISLLKFENRKKNKEIIIISYIGLIRFHDHNKKVILKFKNDKRFLLKFIGTDAISLKEFCEKNNVFNVELIDMFPPEKTLDFYYETDIINNLYGNNSPLLDYALSNKLYYAAKLKMPILVCPNTYMEKISNKYGFGFTFNLDDPNACDKLYNYYKSIDWSHFSIGCEKFINDVNNDNKYFEYKVKEFIMRI